MLQVAFQTLRGVSNSTPAHTAYDPGEDYSKRKLNPAEKRRLGDLVVRGEATTTALAQRHNLLKATVSNWVKAARENREIHHRGRKGLSGKLGRKSLLTLKDFGDDPVAAALFARTAAVEPRPRLTVEQRKWLAQKLIMKDFRSKELATVFLIPPCSLHRYTRKLEQGRVTWAERYGRPKGAKNKIKIDSKDFDGEQQDNQEGNDSDSGDSKEENTA